MLPSMDIVLNFFVQLKKTKMVLVMYSTLPNSDRGLTFIMKVNKLRNFYIQRLVCRDLASWTSSLENSEK